MVSGPLWAYDQFQLAMLKRVLITHTATSSMRGRGRGATCAAVSGKAHRGPHFGITNL